MDLEEIILDIQTERLKDSDAALKNIANSETYLQQAYEGRYLFELIQNVRDANKELGIRGSIFIGLENNTLCVSNTGAAFTENGIKSITTIGDSPKDSLEFIGFKGIGFKSVHEISDTPYVVTEWGSLVFDKNKTKQLLQTRGFKDKDIPLFFIPHFHDLTITEEDKNKSIVTKIVLPLKSKIGFDEIKKTFNEIGIHQLLLLGSLKELFLKNKNEVFHFRIDEDELNGLVSIERNDLKFRFKHFKPSQQVQIPDNIIESLEDKEKELYAKNSFLDISLVFDLDDKSRFLKNEKSKLYLFYPTQITSGFSFIIHSYFLVSPDRKTLRSSPLNNFILQSIAEFICGEWLVFAKRNLKNTLLDFLVFERNGEAPILSALYDSLIKGLSVETICYDNQRGRFYRVDQVIIANGYDKGLFPDNQLMGKRLVYVGSNKTKDWLIKEFNAEYLSEKTIAENIEKECNIQRKKKNFKFFENLYKYLVEHDNLNLKGRRVLLTSTLQLLSSEDYVFYGLKEKMILPASIQRKVNFIHPVIKISDQRQGKGQTGFVEYSTDLLVRRLLRLYEDESVPKLDILVALIKLNISERLLPEVKQKILLPVKGKAKWLNPFTNPIYIENEDLVFLYDDEKFLDHSELTIALQVSNDNLKTRLIQFGAWEIPAVYFANKSTNVYYGDVRYQYLDWLTGYSTPYYVVQGDWILDIPKTINRWFTDVIIAKWNFYNSYIEHEDNPTIKYKSQSSNSHDVPRGEKKNVTSYIYYIKTQKWIKIDEKDDVLTSQDVTGIDSIEAIQIQSSLFKKYLSVLPIHYASNLSLIGEIQLKHLDSRNVSDFKKILNSIYLMYKNKQIFEKEFVSFYHKILDKLFDSYTLLNNKDDITDLQSTFFLAKNELDEAFYWKAANEIYYIEDKPSYEILPSEIKSLIQPVFTKTDKNRFGQIAKRIGANIKKTIRQKLEVVDIVERCNFTHWFLNLAESIAYIEMLLEVNLDSRLEQIKKTEVIICKNISIQVYKDSKYIATLENINYKIDTEDGLKIYVTQNLDIHNAFISSNLLHDLLVEVLGRDLHRIRVSLNELYLQQNKVEYLDRFEVQSERIEELNWKLKGMSLTKIQLVWTPIMNMLSVINPASFFLDGSIDFKKLFDDLEISNNDLYFAATHVDYENFYKTSNIKPLSLIFTALKIDVVHFNLISEMKIDYKNFYLKQLDGIRSKEKVSFEIQLYNFLKIRTVEEKSTFQDKLDEYNSFQFDLESPVLLVDCEELFLKEIVTKYSNIGFQQKDFSLEESKFVLSSYNKNLTAFKNLIGYTKSIKVFFDDFFSINKHRSLLYFDETMNYLFTVFTSQKNNLFDDGTIYDDSEFDIKDYKNLKGSKVEDVKTQSVPNGNSENNKNGVKGKRIDGGKQNPKLELLGIVSEKIVFEKLCEMYSNVEWVSKNAAKAGVNPEGSDIYGCDIKYLDKNSQIHYVEVKGKIDEQNTFFVSYQEYLKALNEKENYHIYLVQFALDNYKRKILNLGNIFLFDRNSSVFNNSKFTANFNSLEITFKR